MRIQTGDFGYRVAKPASPQVGRDAFATGDGLREVAAGVGAIGAVEGQITVANERDQAVVMDRAAREAQAEAKQLAREAKRAEAMTLHATAQNALAAESERISIGIADGTIGKDDAPKLWQESSTKIVEDTIGQVDQSNAELVRAGLTGDLGAHGRSIQREVIKRNRHDIGAGLSGYLEQQERFAGTDLRTAVKQAHMALDGMGPQAGMNPEQIASAKQKFTERATFLVADSWLTKNRDNAPGLKKFLDSLPGNTDLDPGHRNALEGKALNAMTRIENRAIAAENRRTALAGTTLQRLGAAIEAGMPVDAKTMSDAVTMAKGTPYEAQAVGLIQDQRYMADLLKMSPQQQVATVKEIRAKYTKDGAAPEDWASLGRIERAVSKTVEQIQTQPLAYAANRTGAEITPLDLSNPASWADNLKSRSTVLLGQQRQLGGQSSLAGLLPEEVGALKSVLKSATPAQQADTLAKLRQGFGDAAVYRATLGQIAPDDPVTAKAGIFAANDRQSQAGKSVAVEILTGAAILRPDTKQDGTPGKGGAWPMPKDDMLARDWAAYTGTAYAGRSNLRNADFQAAKALYAARAAQEGDQSGEINSRRWRAAMALVTGGVANHAGRETLLPYGMTTGEFKDGIVQRAQAYKVDPSIGRIDALPLLPVGDGQYVPLVGDAVLLDENKQPVLLDFNKPVAPASVNRSAVKAREYAARAGISTQ